MSYTPKNFYKKLCGIRGEKLAQKYLKKQGYNIIKTNYRNRGGEADILAEKDEFIAFVEVKYRTNDKFGLPCEAVDAKKQQRYRNIAQLYLQSNDIDKQVRFDVIEVYGDLSINHIKDAFQ